jgi:hypothetical protein
MQQRWQKIAYKSRLRVKAFEQARYSGKSERKVFISYLFFIWTLSNPRYNNIFHLIEFGFSSNFAKIYFNIYGLQLPVLNRVEFCFVPRWQLCFCVSRFNQYFANNPSRLCMNRLMIVQTLWIYAFYGAKMRNFREIFNVMSLLVRHPEIKLEGSERFELSSQHMHFTTGGKDQNLCI